MLPLKDNIPTLHFPFVTVALIALNLAFFGWQLAAPGDSASTRGLEAVGVYERDERSLQYGAIPQRITHPDGGGCAIALRPGSFGEASGLERSRLQPGEIVCEGTEPAKRAGETGAPLEPLDAAPWWVTLVTSMFMHGGLLHIAGNMLFLWVFGNNIEDSMGRLRFAAFYLLAGLAAVYTQAAIDPGSTTPTIGASGAVAGVLGAYILLHPRARVLTAIFIIFLFTLTEIPAAVLLGIWFVLQFLPAVGQLATPEIGVAGGGVAYFAHVGGFLFGLAAIKAFASRDRLDAIAARYPVY